MSFTQVQPLYCRHIENNVRAYVGNISLPNYARGLVPTKANSFRMFIYAVIVICDDRLNERGKYDLRSRFIHIWYVSLSHKPYSDHLLAKVLPKRPHICGKIWHKYEVRPFEHPNTGTAARNLAFQIQIVLLKSELLFLFQDCLRDTSYCCCSCGFARCPVM